MKTLYIEPPKKQKYVYLLLGGLFFLQGVLNLSEEKTGLTLTIAVIQIVSSIFFILHGMSVIKPESRYIPKIYLGDEDITLFSGLPLARPKTVTHDKIKLIQLKPESLTVITTHFDFEHSIDYQGINKKEIVEEISEYAEDKNLPIERINYRNV